MNDSFIKMDKALTFPRAVYMAFMIKNNLELDSKHIRDIQKKRLKKLLIFAYENIPFYRERFESVNFSPYDFTEMESICRLPILNKDEYKLYVEKEIALKQAKYEKYYKDSTSGSTGKPLHIYRSWDERSYMLAKWLRVMLLNGYFFNHRTYSLPSPHRIVEKDSWLQLLGIGKRHTVAYTETVEKMINGYITTEPDFFYGNKSQLVMMALEIANKNIKIKKPKYYAVGAETLDDNSKRIIQDVFGISNMFEVYGAVELGGILAFQVKGIAGLHFCHDTNYLELENNGRINDKAGNCIITDLYIRSFPLIRYRLGDWLEMTMPDKHKMPIVKRIRGREDDWIVLSDGRKLPFHYFYEIMAKHIDIIQFRIIQETQRLIRVEIVLKTGVDKKGVELILIDDLRRYVDCKFQYKFDFLDSIKPDDSGKLRMVINKTI